MKSGWKFHVGVIILFLGLLWMMLPHTFHSAVEENIIGKEGGAEHFVHIIQGLLPAIVGIVMIYQDEKSGKKIETERKR